MFCGSCLVPGQALWGSGLLILALEPTGNMRNKESPGHVYRRKVEEVQVCLSHSLCGNGREALLDRPWQLTTYPSYHSQMYSAPTHSCIHGATSVAWVDGWVGVTPAMHGGMYSGMLEG